MKVLKKHDQLNFYAIDSKGTEYSSGYKSVTALTWGCFPNKEILQPTVFDPDTFIVWSQEAFQLWTKSWASLYNDESESAALLYEVYLHFISILFFNYTLIFFCFL